MDREIRIRMSELGKLLKNLNLEPQLFAQLTLKARLRRLAGFKLAAGKLPEAPEADAGRSQTYQNPIIVDKNPHAHRLIPWLSWKLNAHNSMCWRCLWLRLLVTGQPAAVDSGWSQQV